MAKSKVGQFIKTHLLTLLIIVSVIAAIIGGVILRAVHDSYSARTVMYVNFIGDLFLRIIRALILPLIVSSLIAAIGPLDISLSRKIGARAIVYILSTTIISVCLGIILVTTVKPGGTPDDSTSSDEKTSTIADTLLDLIRFVMCLTSIDSLSGRNNYFITHSETFFRRT
jgi:Na+/H+-dicarboxylate symporter